MDQHMFWLTVKELLTGDDLFFGSPLEKFYAGLKGGLYSPQITCLRNSLCSLQKKEYYHSLRSYHENMTRAFDEMKQVWDRHRPNAITVEERINVWNSRRNCKPKFVVDLNAFPDEDILNKGEGNVETLPLPKKAKNANQGDNSGILLNGLVCGTNRKAKGVLKLKPIVADVGRSQVMQALPGKLEQPSKRMPKGVLKIRHKYDPLNQVKPRGKLEQISSDIWGVHADAPSVSPPQFASKKDEVNFCKKLPVFCQINRDGRTYRSPVVIQDSQKEWSDEKKNWNILGTQQSMPIKEGSAISKKECLQPALDNYQEKRLNAIISAAGSRIPNNCSGNFNIYCSENAVPVVSLNSCKGGKKLDIIGGGGGGTAKSQQLQRSSLQLCMKLSDPSNSSLLGDSGAAARPWEQLSSSSSDVWDQFSDSESAPASSWSTLPNRLLLYRPLPVDVGRCACIVAKERTQGRRGLAFYTLYTNEGQGRQDGKLAVAWHRRRNGRSEFIVAQNPRGILCSSDESFLGSITANLMGSKYQIWDQGNILDSTKKQSRRLLGVVMYIPTITTITGNYRSLRAWVPKYQSMELKNSNTTQIQHMNGLPKD